MISGTPEQGGPEKRPTCRATSPLAAPAPAPGMPNDFGVCVKGPHILVHNILTKEPITLTKTEALNLAAWIVALSGVSFAEFVLTAITIRKPEPADLTLDEHKQRHIALHRAFDELLGDWISQTHSLPSKSTVRELMEWSYQQTLNPTEPPK